MNINTKKQDLPSPGQIILRKPKAEDGLGVNQLVSACPPLDENSVYCNLLQCSHFADTACAAETEGKIVGFMSGYLRPDKTNTLFIWQVAVAEFQRGQGLAKKMLLEILQRPVCDEIRYIETTITKGNEASWKTFSGFANELNCPYRDSLYFSREQHFLDQHDDEYLLTIGPFDTLSVPNRNTHPYLTKSI